jgi:urease accessory protein
MEATGTYDFCAAGGDRRPASPAGRAGGGWRAELALAFARQGARTVLAARRQRGPLLVQRPFYPEGDGVCHTYVLHPPAGIVGGDDLHMTFDLDQGAHGLVTTPAATRWYFSRGRPARVCQSATLADGATLEWLPQENLLFDGAHARLETRIALAGAARFCGWEILGLGRPAGGEIFQSGRIDVRFELFRDRQPLLLERWRGEGGLAGLRGHTACATFLATAAGAPALAAARAVLGAAPGALCAATLIGDVLVARGLAAHCEPLENAFSELWSALRPLLLGRVAVPPRIWHT